MENNGSILSVATLNVISFDRSRKWGAFFEKYAHADATNNSIEIPLDKLEEYVSNERDEHEDESSDSTENTDMEIDIEAMLDITCNTVKPKADCTYHKAVKDDSDGESLQDALNATLPVLVEHKLQCKQAGIDRILNTFDTNKIERKVGDWLRRSNHSIIGVNSTALSNVSCGSVRPLRRVNELSCIESESDTDSLHSFDTARYIKASKKSRDARSRHCSNACPSMSIKAYCTSQSKREALRKKYGMDHSDNEELFMRALRRRESKFREQTKRSDYKIATLQDNNCPSTSSRRKHMRKMSLPRCNDTPSSFSDDSSCCDSKKAVRSRTKSQVPKLRGVREDRRSRSLAYVKRLHRQRINNTLSSSSSTQSPKNAGLRERQVYNKPSRNLPKSSEHECIISRKLSVPPKNGYHHHGSEFNSKPTHDHKGKKTPKVSNSSSPMQDQLKVKRVVDKKKSVKTDDVTKSNTKSAQKQAKKRDKSKGVSKAKQTTSDASQYMGDSTFEEHLNIAIQLSTELQLNEQNSKMMQNALETNGKDNQKATNLKFVDLTETNKKNSTNKVSTTENKIKRLAKKRTNTDKEQQKPQKSSMNTNEQNETQQNAPSSLQQPFEQHRIVKKNELTTIYEQSDSDVHRSTSPVSNNGTEKQLLLDEDITPEIKLRPQPKSVKLRKLRKLSEHQDRNIKMNEPVFTPHHNFRNSTALPNDTATKRELLDTTATSSLIRGEYNGRQLKLNTVCENTLDSNGRDDDCGVVSSTMGDQQQPENSSHTSRERILLYTPNAKHMVPSNCLHDDRFVVTKESLTNAIGERSATKFLKYYVGRREFNRQSTVYYRPPLDGLHSLEYSDDSDVDALDLIDQCGDLCESFQKQ